MPQNIDTIVSAFAPTSVLAAAAEATSYGSHIATQPDPSFATIAAVLVTLAGVLLFVVSVTLLILASVWRVFEKAGLPGWAALIPFYNTVKVLEITNRPLWWVLLTFVPVVNIVVSVAMVYRLALVFGRGAWFTVGLVVLPFIFLPILAFGKSKYENHLPHAKPMTDATKWALIALVVALATWRPFFPPVHNDIVVNDTSDAASASVGSDHSLPLVPPTPTDLPATATPAGAPRGR